MTTETPIHQWTDDNGDVLILRFSDRNGCSSSDRIKDGKKVSAKPFQHPRVVGETVTAPDWTPNVWYRLDAKGKFVEAA